MSLEQAVDSLTWKCIHCTVKGYERLIPLSVIAQAHQSDCFYCRTLRGALDVLEPGWERSCAEESMTLRFSWGGDLPSFTPSKGASTVYLYISLCHGVFPASKICSSPNNLRWSRIHTCTHFHARLVADLSIDNRHFGFGKPRCLHAHQVMDPKLCAEPPQLRPGGFRPHAPPYHRLGRHDRRDGDCLPP